MSQNGAKTKQSQPSGSGKEPNHRLTRAHFVSSTGKAKWFSLASGVEERKQASRKLKPLVSLPFVAASLYLGLTARFYTTGPADPTGSTQGVGGLTGEHIIRPVSLVDRMPLRSPMVPPHPEKGKENH